jgi:Tol biopolymer transport system component
MSPDGRFLSYLEANPITGSDLWILTLPAPGGSPQAATAQPFVKTRFAEGNSDFSPDGPWLAYQSNESGRLEVYVRAFPEGVRKWTVSTEGGLVPKWSPTGREIFYRSTSGMMMAATVETSSEFRVTATRPLFDARSPENDFDVTRWKTIPHDASRSGGGCAHPGASGVQLAERAASAVEIVSLPDLHVLD